MHRPEGAALSAPADPTHRPGLRERKKARTRSAIQTAALALFRTQGYDQTTVEQICAEAEVSASTFYRYFPTKEDVALHDRYDPVLIAAFRAQPPELTPVEALRTAIRAVFDRLPDEERAQERERATIIASVPAVRARALDQLGGALRLFVDLLSERSGRDPDDVAVRSLAGAVFGIGVAATMFAVDDPDTDPLELFDAGLSQLEAGLPI
jgi:AcrR family transcriptional regulator